MKEHPILFKAPMIRAILEGRKTQTRRVLNPQPREGLFTGRQAEAGRPPFDKSPYGVAGDHLWVKETWRTCVQFNDRSPNKLPFAGEVLVSPFLEYLADGTHALRGKTRVSIHMPRWASRIILEVTDIRAERLNDISHRDAVSEGVEYDLSEDGGDPLSRYQQLWDSIHGTDSWSINPFVWVISFNRLQP